SHVQAMRDFALLGTLGLTGAFVCAVAVLPAILMLTDRRPELDAISRIRFGAERLVGSLSRRRRLWITASLIVFAAALVVVFRSGGDVLPLESDLTVMHPRPNPAIEAQYHIAQRFGISPDSLVVYLHAPDPNQLLDLAYDVNDRLRQRTVRATGIVGTFGLATLLPDPRTVPQRIASVSSVDADRVVADFESALVENGFSPQAFEQYARFLKFLLTQRAVPSVQSLVAYPRIAETVLPSSARRGVPPDEAITLVFVDGSLNLDRDRFARDKVIQTVRGALSGLGGATVTGLGVVSHDTEQTVRRELPRLVLVAVAIVAVYLAVHFRSLPNALLALVPTIFGMVVAAAALRLLGQKLNMINLVAVPLLIGIDVDYGIFLVSLTRIRRPKTDAPGEPPPRVAPVLHAVIMCATATILGYVSLVWASVPAERSLGIAAAVGIAACLAGAMLLVAPLISSRRP
ncbi:MAG TPA: MMPL family transporter, partial [Tepidisphaeraceae bacterium]|nr:MMPL family transporter [Tepidisphaeraceae bacterium]